MIVEPVARLAGDGGFAAESVEAAVDMVEPGLTGIDLLVGLLEPLVKVVRVAQRAVPDAVCLVVAMDPVGVPPSLQVPLLGGLAGLL